MAVNVTGGALEFDAVIKAGQFEAVLTRMERRLEGLTTTANKEAGAIDNLVRRTVAGVSSLALLAGAGNFVSDMVRIRGEFQQLEVAFNTMLGSKEKADKLLREVTEFAATTPFELKEVAGAAKQLLAFGISADKIKDTLRSLGDVAAGLGQPLGEIAYLFGTIKTQGVAMTIDVRQFAQRGIPIYEALSKVLGVATEKVGELITAGKVGFPEIERAFQHLTGEGSKFGGLMEAQSKTLAGLQSNLADSVSQMFNELGKSQEGIFASIIRGATSLVKNYEEVIRVIKVIAITYGTYRAALIATNVVEKVSVVITNAHVAAMGRLTVMQKLAAVSTAVWNRVTALLNKTMLANPYVAVAAAIVGLIAAMALLTDRTTAQQRAQEQINDANEKHQEHIENLKSKTGELVALINDESSTRFAQVRAFKELQQLYPGVLNNMDLLAFKTLSAEDAQKRFNKAIDELDIENANSQLSEATKRVEELRIELEKAKKDQGNKFTFDIQDDLNTAIDKVRQLKEGIEAIKEAQFEANATPKELADHYTKIKNQLIDQRAELEKNIEKQEAQIAAADAFKLSLDNVNLNFLNAQIDTITAKLNSLTAKGTPIKDKAFFETQKKNALAKIAELDEEALGTKEFNRLKAIQVIEINKADKALERYETTVKSTNKSTDTANKIQQEFNRLLGDGKNLLDAITQAKESANETGLTDESLKLKKINERYDDLILNIDLYNHKVDEFNKKNPKTPVQKVGQVLVNEINQARSQELTNNALKIDADLFKENLDKKQRLFEQFENAKSQIGEKNAKELFEKELGDYRSFLELLEAERKKLLPKVSFGIANEGELGKFEKIVEGISNLQQNQAEEDFKRQQRNFTLLLNENVKFNDEKNRINKKYDALQSQLNFDSTVKDKEARKKILDQERKEKLAALQEERDNLLTKAGFQFINEDEVNRFRGIINSIDDLQGDQSEKDLKRQQDNLASLLNSTIEFNNQKAAINKKFDEQEAALRNDLDAKNKDAEFERLQEQRKRELALLEEDQNKFLANIGVGVPDVAELEKFKAVLSGIKDLKDKMAEDEKAIQIKNLEELLAATVNFNKAKLAIDLKYDKLEDAARIKFKGQELEDALKLLRERRKQELEELADEIAQQLPEFKKLFGGIQDLSDAAAKKVIADAKARLAILKIEGKQSAEFIRQFENAIKEAEDALGSRLPDRLNAVSSIFGQLAGSVRGLNSDLADTLDTLGSMVKASSDVATAFKEFKKNTTEGDIAGVTSIVSAVQTLIGIIEKSVQSKKDAKQAVLDFQAKVIAGELEYNQVLRQREIQQAVLNKTTLKGLQDQNKLLKEQKKLALESFDEIFKKLQTESFISQVSTKNRNPSLLTGAINLLFPQKEVKQQLESLAGKSFEDIEKLFLSNQLTDKAKALFEQLQKLKQEGVDIDALLEQNKLRAQEIFTGTTASNITDSITEGFRNGLRSVQDFASTTEDIIRQAMLSALKFQVLEEPIKKLFEKFAIDAESGGGLDLQEVADFTQSINNTIQDAAAFVEEIEKATGIKLNQASNSQNSLAGSIRAQLTEETGTVIAGQFGGLRLTALDILNISRQQLEVQSRIQINTGLAAERLLLIYDRQFYFYETRGIKVR